MAGQEAPMDVLTQDQRDKIDQFLGNPLMFPPEFKQYLTDYLATNIPPIPVSQLLGYKGTLARYEFVANFSDGNTSPERTWTDLPDDLGPEVTGLADGVYWAAWGFWCPGFNAGGQTSRMGLSINGADPQSWAGAVALDAGKSVWRADRFRLAGGEDNNTLRALYYFDLGGGADGEFANRWMATMRIT